MSWVEVRGGEGARLICYLYAKVGVRSDSPAKGGNQLASFHPQTGAREFSDSAVGPKTYPQLLLSF